MEETKLVACAGDLDAREQTNKTNKQSQRQFLYQVTSTGMILLKYTCIYQKCFYVWGVCLTMLTSYKYVRVYDNTILIPSWMIATTNEIDLCTLSFLNNLITLEQVDDIRLGPRLWRKRSLQVTCCMLPNCRDHFFSISSKYMYHTCTWGVMEMLEQAWWNGKLACRCINHSSLVVIYWIVVVLVINLTGSKMLVTVWCLLLTSTYLIPS